MRLGVVIASTREGRFGPTVARWFAEQVETVDAFDLDTIDLAQIEVPAQPFTSHEHAVDLRARIAAADAVVIVTPEYNHSFPGTLKNAIDLAREEWFAKPIAFVSYGGLSGGLRAVEHLRLIFAELHAVTIRETVSFHNAHGSFDAEGQPLDGHGSQEAAAKMLHQLSWWARALLLARTTEPYPA
ncbi:NADPH-dependent FMN reductase [Micromonospora sp. DT31]|uniref:NADPH-dependent FMN reductase n=1 Tax=Micromonospora sp. DT31 TaxID=3393434 RepID=UPI003CF58986